MKKALETIQKAVDMEKLANEGAGLTLFANIEEMASQFDLTVEEIQKNTYDKDLDVTSLNQPFIVYDFNVSEFEFMVDKTDVAINKMIERINSK